MSVQLPPHTLLRLVEQLRRAGGVQDISEAIATAIEFWLDAKTALPPGADPANIRGYQWKSLFLPEGTILRSWSYGEHNYARVEGDKIMHEGHSVTPNEFARSFARTARNAWFDLSVRRPGDKHFKMADLLRKEQAKQRAETPPVSPLPTLPTPAAEPAPVPAPARARNIDPAPGWELPERRKFRYRLEDVAY
ncbi:hypothetical protein GEV01_25830 [Rugamonas sp. FT103W]|uniref:Uncharacterized protein n=2 Tax=Rugamonas rivuli TaxID=2743358 RepID=A0A843SM26_9BURK|nr:hypothetical protein [Rugamonas rivuli]